MTFLNFDIITFYKEFEFEELDGPAVSALGVRSGKLSNVLELLRASEGTLSSWSQLHLQSLNPTSVSRRVDIRQAAGRKNNCRIFITT
jgi:hypothetical protein